MSARKSYWQPAKLFFVLGLLLSIPATMNLIVGHLPPEALSERLATITSTFSLAFMVSSLILTAISLINRR